MQEVAVLLRRSHWPGCRQPCHVHLRQTQEGCTLIFSCKLVQNPLAGDVGHARRVGSLAGFAPSDKLLSPWGGPLFAISIASRICAIQPGRSQYLRFSMAWCPVRSVLHGQACRTLSGVVLKPLHSRHLSKSVSLRGFSSRHLLSRSCGSSTAACVAVTETLSSPTRACPCARQAMPLPVPPPSLTSARSQVHGALQGKTRPLLKGTTRGPY